MNATLLPDALNLDTAQDLLLYRYQTTEDITKTKIILSKNTISFLKNGVKGVFGDDKNIHTAEERFVMMKSGNCLMTETVSSAHKNFESILLFFTDEAILRFLERHKFDLSKPVENRAIYSFEYDSYIRRFVLSLEQVLQFPKALQTEILKHKFEEIMLYLVHKYSVDFLKALVQNIDNKLSRLISIAENNKHNKLSMEELAFLCNMSISTFKRTFQKHYKTTPMKWFTEQRLNYTAFMLQTKRNRPVDIYEDAGYENLSNFVQAFKRKFGVTPKQYQMSI